MPDWFYWVAAYYLWGSTLDYYWWKHIPHYRANFSTGLMLYMIWIAPIYCVIDGIKELRGKL